MICYELPHQLSITKRVEPTNLGIGCPSQEIFGNPFRQMKRRGLGPPLPLEIVGWSRIQSVEEGENVLWGRKGHKEDSTIFSACFHGGVGSTSGGSRGGEIGRRAGGPGSRTGRRPVRAGSWGHPLERRLSPLGRPPSLFERASSPLGRPVSLLERATSPLGGPLPLLERTLSPFERAASPFEPSADASAALPGGRDRVRVRGRRPRHLPGAAGAGHR